MKTREVQRKTLSLSDAENALRRFASGRPVAKHVQSPGLSRLHQRVLRWAQSTLRPVPCTERTRYVLRKAKASGSRMRYATLEKRCTEIMAEATMALRARSFVPRGAELVGPWLLARACQHASPGCPVCLLRHSGHPFAFARFCLSQLSATGGWCRVLVPKGQEADRCAQWQLAFRNLNLRGFVSLRTMPRSCEGTEPALNVTIEVAGSTTRASRRTPICTIAEDLHLWTSGQTATFWAMRSRGIIIALAGETNVRQLDKRSFTRVLQGGRMFYEKDLTKTRFYAPGVTLQVRSVPCTGMSFTPDTLMMTLGYLVNQIMSVSMNPFAERSAHRRRVLCEALCLATDTFVQLQLVSAYWARALLDGLSRAVVYDNWLVAGFHEHCGRALMHKWRICQYCGGIQDRVAGLDHQCTSDVQFGRDVIDEADAFRLSFCYEQFERRRRSVLQASKAGISAYNLKASAGLEVAPEVQHDAAALILCQLCHTQNATKSSSIVPEETLAITRTFITPPAGQSNVLIVPGTEAQHRRRWNASAQEQQVLRQEEYLCVLIVMQHFRRRYGAADAVNTLWSFLDHSPTVLLSLRQVQQRWAFDPYVSNIYMDPATLKNGQMVRDLYKVWFKQGRQVHILVPEHPVMLSVAHCMMDGAARSRR